MEIGNVVIFESNTGRIIHQTGESKGDVLSNDEINDISFVRLPYGFLKENEYLLSIDPTNNEPIVKVIEIPKTQEQEYIQKLEDVLLLQTENEIGGIL